jgi:NADH-ubiquinone oxidoreductase chain 5
MALPLTLLCLGSVFSGYFLKDIFVGMGTGFFKHAIHVRATNVILIDVEFIPIWVKLTPTVFSLCGLAFALALCSSRPRVPYGLVSFNEKTTQGSFLRGFRNIFGFLGNKWNFDLIYNYYVSLPFFKSSYWFCFIFIDQYFLKFFGPVGVSLAVYRLGKPILGQPLGLINNYAFCMAYMLLIFLLFVWLGYYRAW